MGSKRRAAAAAGLAPMVPGDILGQVLVEDHDLAPDASFAVVVVRTTRRRSYRSHLRVVGLDGGDTDAGRAGRGFAITGGTIRDTSPRISPDGLRLAFIRSWPKDPERPAGIFILQAGGAEPVLVTAPEHGVSELAWSPDGRRLAFVAPSDPPRFAEGGFKDGEPLARRIRTLYWRWDGEGMRDRWDHLWVVRARAGAKARRLTNGKWAVRGAAWSPDGREIAFAADMGPEPDLRPCPSIHAVAACGGEPRLVLALAGNAGAPAWSPDGRWIACTGVDVAEPFDDVVPGVFVGPSDGSRPAIALAPDLELPPGALQMTDLNGWASAPRPGPAWIGPDRVVAVVTDRGRAVPFLFPVDPETGVATGPAVPMTRGSDGAPATADAACWTMTVAGATVSVTGTLDDRPQELMVLDDGGALRTVTGIGSAWRRRLRPQEMRLLHAPGPGGPIECWLASPPDAGDRRLPLVVDIHGGPLGVWAPAPSLEVQLLVARGYRVLLPQIRGSVGFGAAWITPQLGDWGGVDADDVHAAIDHIVDLGLADPDRLGALGLSYGGFVVNWLVATSGRFRAAVSENGTANQVSTWANSDAGPEYCRSARMGDVFTPEGVALLWRQSPLAHVADIHTPLLLLQAGDDMTCPAADAEQLFIALRSLRREVEYVLYPGETHVYSILGRPDRRIDRMTRMLAWFEEHLGA
ncbi:MAG: S9 family peptidase [Chloroflexota bacterium]